MIAIVAAKIRLYISYSFRFKRLGRANINDSIDSLGHTLITASSRGQPRRSTTTVKASPTTSQSNTKPRKIINPFSSRSLSVNG